MSAPPVPYFGAKITLAPQIVSLLPPHEHYVEPYCGSLAVLLAKPEQHRELAEALLGCRASVVLSGYPSALYQELYADWYRCELPAATCQGGAWVNRTEVLWSNRPLGSQPALFDGEAS